MAAPAQKTIKDLSGKWILNKTLSDDTDPVLALQGIGWFTRKAISLATVTLAVTQYNDGSIAHIDIEQTATGGIKGTTENRTLDWEPRSTSDHIFGNLVGKSRWTGKEQVDDAYLAEGWLEKGNIGDWIESYVVNEEKGWTAQQIWGFAEVDGERRYTRRVKVTKGDKVMRIRMVYDYVEG